MTFTHHHCGQTPMIVKLIDRHIGGLFELLPNGKYDYKPQFEDGTEQYICGICDHPLTDEEAQQFIKLIYLPPEAFPDLETETKTDTQQSSTPS